MEYIIVRKQVIVKDDYQVFVEMVNDSIKDGYCPVGGVFCDGANHMQAMIKNTPSE